MEQMYAGTTTCGSNVVWPGNHWHTGTKNN